MNDQPERRPILYNGQIYSQPVEKSGSGGPKEYYFSFEEARDIVINDIGATKAHIESIPRQSRMPNEFIISVVIQSDFIAKSYYPHSLFDESLSRRFGIVEIGSRSWMEEEVNGSNEPTSDSGIEKLLFVRATEDSLKKLEDELHRKPSTLRKNFKDDIRKISSVGIMPGNRQISSFPEDWDSGIVEAVLHPFDVDRSRVIPHFKEALSMADIDMKLMRLKQYDNGVTFVGFQANKNALELLKGYNPLRVVHPLKMRNLINVPRGTTIYNGPLSPQFIQKPNTVIGVIDGGIVEDNPFLKDYTESVISVDGDPIPELQDHGSQVTGAVLYGPLNSFSNGFVLPEPKVSVRNFRVLSTSTSPSDLELYDVIDAMEKIIPANDDIRVYNVSLGPIGPIQDDYISRFTYSCDQLSNKHGVLFCIAVGNDGEIDGFNRIQAPADSVNNLGVGAYSIVSGEMKRAPYSCIGPGREGCKMKPDLLAFGGCDQHPIHLVANEDRKKVWSYGTSFASPIVAGFAGQLIDESEEVIDSLVAKALIIHSSANDQTIHDINQGHGILPSSVRDITSCEENSYTLIFTGTIEKGKFMEFLIPWDEAIQSGKAFFKWTVAVVTDIDHLSTDDYTSSSVEVAFYPNRNKYLFTNEDNTLIDGKLKKTEVVDVEKDPERAILLVDNGWKQSRFPKTDSTTKPYMTESELRDDLKWDSIDCRSISKKAKSINEPVFHIHALGRGKRNKSKDVRFALILTVNTPKAEVDLYSSILNTYSALIPLQVKSRAEVTVHTDSRPD